MCNAFSTSAPSAGISRLLPLAAIAQGVAVLAQEWRQVEELQEARRLKEQELRHERARMRAQLLAFEGILAAQVGLEQARAQSFCAAMAAVTPTQDREAVLRILGMGQEILDRPLALPVMNADGRV